MALNDMHDDEIAARLGLAVPATMEQRIEAHVVRAMPEPEDVDPQSLLGTSYTHDDADDDDWGPK